MTMPLIILGGGGQAAVLLEVLSLLQRPVLGFSDRQPPAEKSILNTVEFLGNDNVLRTRYPPDAVTLINGLGSTGIPTQRATLFNEFSAAHYHFADIIHPTAWFSPSAQHSQGLQILAGAIVNTGTTLGENVLINSRAVVEHHCTIGDHCHIASGVVICGGCRIGNTVHVGAGAVINHGITIGDGAIIASGAVVITDVPAHSLMAGVPAQSKTRSKNHE